MTDDMNTIDTSVSINNSTSLNTVDDGNIAVKIDNVYKTFHIPHENEDSIKMKVVNSFRKHDKEADEYRALKGISLDIHQGEFIGIVGRNGAGKSTLLKIIAEIYQPTTGSVSVRGKLVPFIELGVGFNPNLSGHDNVYLNGAMLGFSKEEVDEMYDSIVEFAELEEFMDQKLKNYSSGMKVRLAFSVAVKANADILLLDEVLAVGDASFQKKCYAYFDKLKEEHKTIIFVTHSMGLVRKYCTRAVLIEGGLLTFDGDPDIAADKYMQLFVKPTELLKTNEGESEENTRPVLRFGEITSEVTSDQLSFSVEIINESDGDIDGMTFGLSIKDQSGRTCSGFNTVNIPKPIQLSLPAKSTQTVAITTPIIFSQGFYTVDATLRALHDDEPFYDERCVEQFGDATIDRRTSATNFSIHSDKHAGYSVILPAQLEY